MKLTTAGLLLLALLAVASAWWLSTVTREVPARSAPQGPAWYFDDATFSATNAAGDTQYRLEAEHIVQDPADETGARLDTVRMEWLQGMRPPLQIRSSNAVIDAQATRVRLAGGVRIVDESAAAPMELATDTLVIDTDMHHAYTDDRITVHRRNSTLTAHGLFADARSGVIRLERDVRGRYVH